MLLYHGMKVACVDFPDVIHLAKVVEEARGHMKINHANTLREFEVEYTPGKIICKSSFALLICEIIPFI